MRLKPPQYRNRSPEEIISKQIYFDSAGYAFRALSWLDVARRFKNVCALQYAALEARQAIEQLLFEELVMSVGTKLDRRMYQECRGNSTQLAKIIRKLSPEYQTLAQFTVAVASVNRHSPPLVTWDHRLLMEHWGHLSGYLHWAGEPKETVNSQKWLQEGIQTVEAAAAYMFQQMGAGYTAIMMPENMQPEIRSLWDRFSRGEIDLNAVKRTADLATPVLRTRTR
jgi:hypothetical protein